MKKSTFHKCTMIRWNSEQCWVSGRFDLYVGWAVLTKCCMRESPKGPRIWWWMEGVTVNGCIATRTHFTNGLWVCNASRIKFTMYSYKNKNPVWLRFWSLSAQPAPVWLPKYYRWKIPKLQTEDMNKHVRAQLISNVLLELHTAQQSNPWTIMYIFHIIPWCFESLENMIKSCAGSIVNIDIYLYWNIHICWKKIMIWNSNVCLHILSWPQNNLRDMISKLCPLMAWLLLSPAHWQAWWMITKHLGWSNMGWFAFQTAYT